jgi:phosphopantetheinyl transferase
MTRLPPDTPFEPSFSSLWVVDRHASSAALAALEQRHPRLSVDDITRAQSMSALPGQRAENWRAGRIALRVIFERVLIEAGRVALADQIRRQPFELTAHGEPSLPGTPFTFSQSDAGPYLLIGLASRGRIGVDLEQPRTFAMSDDRQSRVVAAAREIAGDVGTEHLSLLQAWTRIEAFAKARGPSLARVLTELALIGAAGNSDVRSKAAAVARASGLLTRDLTLSHGLIASVSLPQEAPVPPLRLFATSTE